MGKGLGLLATVAAAALLVPYAAEVKPETNDYEIRSLLLKFSVKSGKDSDGNATKAYSVGFAGMPTRGDIKIIKENIEGGIAKGVDAVKKAAEKFSKAKQGKDNAENADDAAQSDAAENPV